MLSRLPVQLPPLARSFSFKRTWPLGVDVAVFAVLFAVAWGIAGLARYWWGAVTPAVEISRSPWALPGYAFYSVIRLFSAYLLSLVFAIGYGYAAANRPRLERVLIALLDILQSIPVLSFLPGVMLAMISLVPGHQLGIELGSVLLIFTGQVWNMAFSFYSSLKAIPKELTEASSVYGFSAWQRFVQLELPYGVIGLLWNSMVSVAGGWFFLMACEMFVLGKRDFRLPGLGSYLQVAASNGDVPAMCWGIGCMILVIVLIDQVLWRPLIDWSDRFKFEQVESGERGTSFLMPLLKKSRVAALPEMILAPVGELLTRYFAKRHRNAANVTPTPSLAGGIVQFTLGLVAVGAAGYGAFSAVVVLLGIPGQDWLRTLGVAGVTFLRVNLSLLIATLWTVPVGVAIGFNPRLAKIAQPLAQIAASVPATALFPILLLALIQVGGGLGIASILLMLLGTQWYILFNVIAGAIAIPSELREVAKVFGFTRILEWRVVILPGIFPYLVTGLITASGGAWNASIVAEYFHLRGKVFTTYGLGAQISAASDAGRFDLLLLSTVVMAAMVVCINRLVWRPLYRLAETRYRLDG